MNSPQLRNLMNSPAVRVGFRFGVILGAVGILGFLIFVLPGGATNADGSITNSSGWLLTIIGLGVAYLAGRRMSQPPGLLKEPAIAGGVAAGMGALAYGLATFLWVLSLPASAFTPLLVQAFGTPNDVAAYRASVISSTFEGVIVFTLLAIGAGALAGALAGLVERGTFRDLLSQAPQPGYPPQPTQPTQPSTGYPPQSGFPQPTQPTQPPAGYVPTNQPMPGYPPAGAPPYAPPYAPPSAPQPPQPGETPPS